MAIEEQVKQAIAAGKPHSAPDTVQRMRRLRERVNSLRERGLIPPRQQYVPYTTADFIRLRLERQRLERDLLERQRVERRKITGGTCRF